MILPCEHKGQHTGECEGDIQVALCTRQEGHAKEEGLLDFDVQGGWASLCKSLRKLMNRIRL